MITETKTDSTFPLDQFAIQGYSKPYRFDSNKNGGRVFINVREDISSRELKIHNASEDIESTFIKINLIKTRWLFCGCYDPPSQSDQYFFENIGKTLDRYSKHYEKFMLVGDFNVEESELCLSQFYCEYNAKNIVKENTCFKNALNPNCIDLFITNSPLSFQNTIAVSNRLSGFHKMVIKVINKNTVFSQICIEKNNRIISDNFDLSEEFSTFFEDAVRSLNVKPDEYYLRETENLSDPVEIRAIRKFENHPSVQAINYSLK